MNWKLILAAGALLFSSALYAQTPDGQTPANEGICDDLVFQTPGLYGLCIAYCEAQDLDGIDFTDPEAVIKAMPSEKILRNYNKKKGLNDPDMPCLISPPECACFTIDEIRSISEPPWRQAQCYEEPVEKFGHAYAQLGNTVQLATSSITPVQPLCYYSNSDLNEFRLRYFSNFNDPQEVAAAWACFDIIYQVCQERGDCYMSSSPNCPNYPMP